MTYLISEICSVWVSTEKVGSFLMAATAVFVVRRVSQAAKSGILRKSALGAFIVLLIPSIWKTVQYGTIPVIGVLICSLVCIGGVSVAASYSNCIGRKYSFGGTNCDEDYAQEPKGPGGNQES